MKRLIMFVVLLGMGIVFAPRADAGILRTLGVCGKTMAQESAHMVKSVGKDLFGWIY